MNTLTISVPLQLLAQNIALNKPYVLSAAPNYYPNTAPAGDKSSLTDGKYTDGYFWAKTTTVGWQGREVTISIDLGEVQPISEVDFNTARNTNTGVNFPKNIYVFI